MIVELRQYTLHPGRRDELIELFERELLAPQEAVGMRVVGTFRDQARPNVFVWIRSFPDMAARRASLEAFYFGSVWRAHRDAANATMVDSDDVLLLRGDLPQRELVRAPLCAAVYAAPVDVPGALARWETETSANTFPRLPVRTGEHVVVLVDGGRALAAHPAQLIELVPTARSRLRYAPSSVSIATSPSRNVG